MDIDELNKFQIVLLTLLVSFVTSIATGIVTVTLLSQAPPAVTETVNQVVERTIQTIVPQNATSTATATTKETTVVVKEDDLITNSIQASLGKTGRVFSGLSSTTPVVGLAAVISPTMLVTDSSIVDKDHLVSVGQTAEVFTVYERFPDIGIAILIPKSASTTVFVPFRVADISATKLGATIVALVSVTEERVAIGTVASHFDSTNVAPVKDAQPVVVHNVDTSIGASLVPGTPLVNVFGDLVGISTGVSETSGGRGTFIAASDVIALLNASRATSTPTH